MDTSIRPLAAILRLNQRLMINCLDGLDDEAAQRRHASGVNSASFIAAHVTDSRFFILRTLGGLLDNPLSASLDKDNNVAKSQRALNSKRRRIPNGAEFQTARNPKERANGAEKRTRRVDGIVRIPHYARND
jgi:hypothetical protein